MKRNDSLFQLIKSLTKSEKRFFKIYSLRHVIGEENNYIQLFDAIDRQTNYNEEQLLKKFAHQKFARRLAVAKSYLYDLILKAMNQYHAQATPESQINELLGNIQFLYYKGIYNIALLQVQKAQKLATDYQLTPYQIPLIKWQKQLLEASFYATLPAENQLQQIYNQELAFLAQLTSTNQHWLPQSQMYFQYNQKGKADTKAIQQIYNTIQKLPEPTSFEAKTLFLKTQSTYFFLTRNFEQCYQYTQQLILHLETKTEIIKNEPLTYINALNNVLNLTIFLQQHSQHTFYLQKLNTLRLNPAYQKKQTWAIKIFETYFYHQMNHCVSNANFEQALPLIAELEQGLTQYENQIDDMGEIILYFYAFHVCFGCQLYPQAMQWLLKITTHHNHTIRQDIYNFAKILLLIVAYEINNPTTTQKIILQTYRFLHKKNTEYELENIVVQAIKNLKNTNNPHQFFSDIYLQLINCTQNNPQQQKPFAYFDFLAWLKSKIQNETFATILKQKK